MKHRKNEVPEGYIEINPEDSQDTTDWTAIDALTDEEIERRAASDPENPILGEDFWKNAKLVLPAGNKRHITIRIDSDVLDFFQKDGPGYQKRINAVLRSYYETEVTRQLSS